MKVRLANRDCSSGGEPFHHGGAVFRHEVAVDKGACGCAHAFCAEEIFQRDGNAVERPTVNSGEQFFIALASFGEGLLSGWRNQALVCVAPLDFAEGLVDQLKTGDFAGAQKSTEFADRHRPSSLVEAEPDSAAVNGEK